MDMENGKLFFVENVNPNASKSEIYQREYEVYLRENSHAHGEIITELALTVEIVHCRSDVHRDFQRRNAIGEEKSVLIGIGFGINGVVTFAFFKGAEGEDRLDHVGIESTFDLTVEKLLEHVDP